jgi:hypothetical protein
MRGETPWNAEIRPSPSFGNITRCKDVSQKSGDFDSNEQGMGVFEKGGKNA